MIQICAHAQITSLPDKVAFIVFRNNHTKMNSFQCWTTYHCHWTNFMYDAKSYRNFIYIINKWSPLTKLISTPNPHPHYPQHIQISFPRQTKHFQQHQNIIISLIIGITPQRRTFVILKLIIKVFHSRRLSMCISYDKEINPENKEFSELGIFKKLFIKWQWPADIDVPLQRPTMHVLQI